MPFDNIKYLPSLLPCTLQMGKTNTPWQATLLRKEDNTLWAIMKMQDEPIPFCQFLGTYRTLRAPMLPMGPFDEMLEYVTIPPHKESLATILRTFSPDQIQRLPYPPQPLLVETNAATANSNTILSVTSTQAILARLKAKNAELQAHFDLLTEAATLKERNQFMEASIRQLAAKLEE